MLVLGVFLSGGVEPAAAQFSDELFERYEIVTGTAARQTFLTGFLLGGPIADIAVLTVDEKGDRRLRIYAFGDGTWAPRLDATLRPGVSFVDVANIGGRDRLITYERGPTNYTGWGASGQERLNWFDPESATERELVEVAMNYNSTPAGLSYAGAELKGPADEGEIPHVDITRDLNRDGRDDLIIPDVDGFRVFIQRRDGTFADSLKLGPREPFRDETGFGESRSYGEVRLTPLTVPWYLSRVHELDYDRDGRTDLVFWNEDHFDVHYQDARGLFDPVAETFTVDVPFDSDGAYSLIFGFSEESPFRLFFGFRKSTKRTVLHSFRDLNGDGVADLVTFSLKGRSLLRQRTLFEVHLGAPGPDRILFARDASTVQSQGKAPLGYSDQWLQDFDGDGQVDIGFMNVRTGLDKMIRALLGTSITMSLELYRLEDGIYPDEPTAKRRIKSDIDVRGGRDAGFWPAVLVGDVNGDGRSDLLVGQSREELHVFFGGPDLLARQPLKVAVALPGSERNSWLADINKDGKQDLFMHHPSTTEPHRLTMLIAR